MTCPFAKFASILPLPPPGKGFHTTHGHPSPLSSSSSSSSSTPSTLSDALRIGTSASHRAVEKSRGVSLLLTSVSSPTTSEVHFDRVDYVRFQVMLTCIYIVLEARLVRSGLFKGDEGLLRELARMGGLLEDVAAHLETVREHTGASLADLAEQAREEHSATPAREGLGIDTEDPQARTELFQLVTAAFDEAATFSPSTPPLERHHIDILHPAQVHATLSYVRALTTLLHPTLLIAHAYTRYLGDLSGGQHIVRKVSKRFPTTHPAKGFAFYSFDETADLKNRFRKAMEQDVEENRWKEVVGEANRAFDLNTGLFESLLPAELRMTPEEAGVMEVEKKVGVARKGRREGVVRGLVVATSALVMAHTLMRVGAGMIAARSGAVEVHA